MMMMMIIIIITTTSTAAAIEQKLEHLCNSFRNALLQDTFDICRKTFASGDEMMRMTLSDKIDLFFHDYSLVPLFAYENYIGAIPYSSRSVIYAHIFCFYITIWHVLNL